jgi:hypothetical protein
LAKLTAAMAARSMILMVSLLGLSALGRAIGFDGR